MPDSIPYPPALAPGAPGRRAGGRPVRPPATGPAKRERELQVEAARLRRDVEALTALTRRQQATIEGLSHALHSVKADAAGLKAHNEELQRELLEALRAASPPRVVYS